MISFTILAGSAESFGPAPRIDQAATVVRSGLHVYLGWLGKTRIRYIDWK